MQKYLYGASVQGIQNFIFQTNKLTEIMGASELVEQICTEAFDEFIDNGEVIVSAAGNIKCIFSTRECCERAVLNFTKKVMEMAPGITISQAVIPFEQGVDFGDAIMRLEELLHVQRNKPLQSTTLGLMGIQRSRRTGLPAIRITNRNALPSTDYLDKATCAKLFISGEERRNATKLCSKAFGMDHISHSQFAYELSDITGNNDWIAVIHADGNGLGKVVQKIGSQKDKLKSFSSKLSDATCHAAQRAFEAMVQEDFFKAKERIPIRPIVLGGDDFTVICRADFAVEYTEAFLRFFEEETGKMLHDELTDVYEERCLSACAGIAFIKSSYPFYYGYELAESLCSQAKTVAKSDINTQGGKLLPKSCLMFHKVQDSFVEDFDAIEERELMPQSDVSWKFGPYFIGDADAYHWTITRLLQMVDNLQAENDARKVKNHVRQWMSIIHINTSEAEQYRHRMLSMLEEKNKVSAEDMTTPCFVPTNNGASKIAYYPAYDILALNSVKNITTK